MTVSVPCLHGVGSGIRLISFSLNHVFSSQAATTITISTQLPAWLLMDAHVLCLHVFVIQNTEACKDQFRTSLRCLLIVFFILDIEMEVSQ